MIQSEPALYKSAAHAACRPSPRCRTHGRTRFLTSWARCHYNPALLAETVICAMRLLRASTFAVVIAAASPAAIAQTSGSTATPKLQCAIGYVTGVGGAEQSFREYIATPDRDKYRYLADNQKRRCRPAQGRRLKHESKPRMPAKTQTADASTNTNQTNSKKLPRARENCQPRDPSVARSLRRR